jgi:hypothetical protein
MKRIRIASLCLVLIASAARSAEPAVIEQAPNTWVKRSPLKDGPVSPGMGYECALGYDPKSGLVVRWAGHNQGGGGEQNAETWVYNPVTSKWALREPNTSPPGVCCAQQNVVDPTTGRYLRFQAFSGSHGWQWYREIYLNNSAVWSYDVASNTWRDLRALPAPRISSLRCASWDVEHQVAVLFGGEGNQEGTVVYDPYTNTFTKMNPNVQPAFRSGGNMVYDEARKVHILFGTQFDDDPRTWTYDLSKNEWRDMKPKNQPPTDRNDAVLAYDRNGKVVVALVRVIDKTAGKEVTAGHLETWAYDAGKNDWKRMEPKREPDGWANRRRVMVAVPEQNLLLCEVYLNPTDRSPDAEREQQIWTYRYEAAKPSLLPPKFASIGIADHSIGINWDSSPSPEVGGYDIFAGSGDKPWQVEFKRVGQREQRGGEFTHQDQDPDPKKVNYFFARAVQQKGKTADSIHIRAQPRIVEDCVVSVVAKNDIRLSWKPVSTAVQYHVERAPVEVFTEDEIIRLKKDTDPLKEPSVGGIKAIGQFTRITKEPVREPRFTDSTVDLSKMTNVGKDLLLQHRFRDDQLDPKGKPYRYGVYAYRIRAVNALEVESGPSPFFLTIPSAPQSVFAQEDGAECKLKWLDNPERDHGGYRIYRMEGPKINGPGQKVTRLNDVPIRRTTFTDKDATKETKRYWVVAVDALGQEGFPSAPVWHYRQYRKFYEPFVGEWHQ